MNLTDTIIDIAATSAGVVNIEELKLRRLTDMQLLEETNNVLSMVHALDPERYSFLTDKATRAHRAMTCRFDLQQDRKFWVGYYEQLSLERARRQEAEAQKFFAENAG